MITNLKIKIYILLLNPYIKLIIYIIYVINLQLLFGVLTIMKDITISHNSIDSKLSLAQLKELIHIEIKEYFMQIDFKEYYGTRMTQIGIYKYKLVTHFYSKYIINDDIIKHFLNYNIEWYNLMLEPQKDLQALVDDVVKQYIIYISLLEIQYNKVLLSPENIIKCEKEIKQCLVNLTESNSRITDNYKMINVESLINNYLQQTDVLCYIMSNDYQKGNMEVLKHYYHKEVINSTYYSFSSFINEKLKFIYNHIQIEIVPTSEINSNEIHVLNQIIEECKEVYVPNEGQILTPIEYLIEENLFLASQKQEIMRLICKLITIKVKMENNDIVIEIIVFLFVKITLKHIR